MNLNQIHLKNTPESIIISRTDSIGDVTLTLPIAGYLKKHFPRTRIYFLGQRYTKPVVNTCEYIDEFIDWSQMRELETGKQIGIIRSLNADAIIHVFPDPEIARLAAKAGIPCRIGTAHRFYHWLYCNRLVRFSRKQSPLHEAQLNFKLLKPLGFGYMPDLQEISGFYGLSKMLDLHEDTANLLDKGRINLILHPKSKGSAREWGVRNFAILAGRLPSDRFKIFITGTKEEGKLLEQEGFFEIAPFATNLTGQLDLDQLISFISKADGIVAASTGPLHLAAALGRKALGIYPPIKPMHPGRWAPLGTYAAFLVASRPCDDCRDGSPCHCMQDISPEEVYFKLRMMFELQTPDPA